MGVEEEADRTLFIRNIDPRVTEELLFELFLQAGPLIKTKIPKDNEGKQKTFGFAVYKHEVSVPYAMKLLDGVTLHGRTLHVQFRSGSSHGNSSGNSQNSSPANIPSPHGQRSQVQLNSPPYTPPPLMQRSFPSQDNLQKHVMMNNMMWQLQAQQMQQLQLISGIPRAQSGGRSYGNSPQQQDSSPYRQQSFQVNSGSHHGKRYPEERGSSHQHGHGRDSYRHHDDRGSSRHYEDKGGNRHHDDRGGNRDGRRRRY